MSILAELLSSKARAEIFRILFGTNQQELHMREIQRLAGLGISSIRQEIEKLERLELLISRKSGNRIYYSANKEHPLFNLVHEMVLKTNGLVNVFQKYLSDDSIDFAFIFGSFANGDEKSTSDIDLFIIGEIGLRELSKQLKEPVKILGREINPHVMDVDEFVKRKIDQEHFLTRVLEAKKIMIIGNEDELRKLG